MFCRCQFVGAVCRRVLSLAAGILFLTGKKFSARCVKGVADGGV